MDELSLRALLEGATSPEPPLGHLVGNSLRAGRKLRQRRRALSAAAAVAAVGLIAAIVPAASGSLADGRHDVQQPSASRRTPKLTTAYVETASGNVVPVDLATNTAGTPIKVPEGDAVSLATMAAATPNGRTVYEFGGTGVTPIDTATNTAGPTITLQNVDESGIAIAPNGNTAYLSTYLGVYPISTATNTLGKRIKMPGGGWAMALTPDGKTLYVLLNPTSGPHAAGSVTPIRTATNTALRPIKVPVLTKTDNNFLYSIAITPNGKTAYVVDGVQEGKPYANSVIPIKLATNTALAPIAIEASGLADGLVIAPGGRTAYVLSSRAVTPIDIATNQAEPPIPLPESAGYAYYMALTPNGKTLYVLTPRGVVPIRTASQTVLPRIDVPKLANFTVLAITPDGRTVYVGAADFRKRRNRSPVLVAGGVVPISTATNTAGRLINLGAPPLAITFAR